MILKRNVQLQTHTSATITTTITVSFSDSHQTPPLSLSLSLYKTPRNSQPKRQLKRISSGTGVELRVYRCLLVSDAGC
ncbi:hypothetical protein Q3G72_001527 [Acer saccharum]|nr:hypothetical protein Q3G72_001527 [Acer saccharum]